MSEAAHSPVMLSEVLSALQPKDGEIYVDGTFGAGGYSRALLDNAKCKVIAIDRDKTAIDNSAALQKEYGDRLHLIHGCYGDSAKLIRDAGYEFVDGYVLDIGVSSMQLDDARRGFSFRYDAPLDMRMDQGEETEDAASIVNSLDEKELADLIYEYGEERYSRRIAKGIVNARAEQPITRTAALAEIIREAVPKKPGDNIDPATRTFQALRIFVNDELEELDRGLCAAESLLNESGRLIVVSFHSLEDRRVKTFLKNRSGQQGRGSRHLPDVDDGTSKTFDVLIKKAVQPSEDEMALNPRARSAKMRSAIRTAQPAHSYSKAEAERGCG